MNRWSQTLRAARRFRWCAAIFLLTIPAAFAFDFPGDQREIAFQLATGIGIERLQAQVDRVQSKAVRGQALSPQERKFLQDLYRAMASGAESSILLRQSGRLMHHYLDASGAPLELDSGIFRNNARVQDQMRRLRDPIRKTRRACQSGRFYMPHPSSPDSVFGLYWGTLQGTPHLDDAGRVHIRWRAEVPWEWPTYESLRRRYGTPHAETFLLPNARSIAAGSRYALHIENGLGGYLVTAGLARSFLAWSEWEE